MAHSYRRPPRRGTSQTKTKKERNKHADATKPTHRTCDEGVAGEGIGRGRG